MAEARAERVGYPAYLEVTRMIALGPTDAHEIEEAMGWTRRPTLRFLRLLTRMELAHVHSWHKPHTGSRCYVERFVLGPGVGEKKPHTRGEKHGRTHMQDKTYRSQGLAFASLLRALSEGATRAELHELSGISTRSLFTLIPAMCERPKMIHIADWRRAAAGQPSPVFMLGNKPDAARPAPLGKGRANKKYRVKVAAREGAQVAYSVFSHHTAASLYALA